MAIHTFFLLLLAAKSMAMWDSSSDIRTWNSPGRVRAVVPAQCTQGGLFCSSCKETYLCVSETATPLVQDACPSDRVCSGRPGAAGCLPFMGANAGDCDCDTIGNVGFLADPYDASKYFICIQPEGQFSFTCDDGLVFSNVTNNCVQEPDSETDDIIQKDSNVPCSTNPIGFYTDDPTCETYTVCISDSLPGILGRCSTGEAFDTSVSQCVAQCKLAPPSFVCPEGGSGAFPDTSDCSIFHICSSGAIFAANRTCPIGQLFDPTSMAGACVPDSTGVVCPVINNCWAAHCDACGGTCPVTKPTRSTTTITINTTSTFVPTSSPTTFVTTTVDDTVDCSNGLAYFADTADCKQFRSCQDNNNNGTFEAILYRCPGDLYYIPSLGHCSLQSNLPTPSGCTIVP